MPDYLFQTGRLHTRTPFNERKRRLFCTKTKLSRPLFVFRTCQGKQDPGIFLVNISPMAVS